MKTIEFARSASAMALALAAALAAGCGESDTSAMDGVGGAGGGAGTTDDTMDDVTGDSVHVVNGCTRAGATDKRGHASVTIRFPVPSTSLKYSPACVRVSAGTKVTWAGSFAAHPLQAGRVNATTHVATVSAGSPIKHTTTGQSATFKLNDVETLGYYCTQHFSLGMKGAVYVE